MFNVTTEMRKEIYKVFLDACVEECKGKPIDPEGLAKKIVKIILDVNGNSI